jgi:hypothetical protein
MEPLDWVGMFKRYVGNDLKTPYFVAVGRLSRAQANNELFVYALFLAVLFGTLGVVALSPDLPHGDALGVSIYAFLVAGAAIFFGYSKQPVPAAICGSAPLGVLIYFALYGFHPNAGSGDKVLQVIIVLLWLRYSWRILNIAQAYPTLREGDRPVSGRD